MSKKQIKVRLVHSTIGRNKNQEQILKGLGLRRIGHERMLEDTPAVRGMANKISHLVKIIEESDEATKTK